MKRFGILAICTCGIVAALRGAAGAQDEPPVSAVKPAPAAPVEAVAGPDEVAAPGTNPVPEFVKEMFAGRELPPVPAGYKVVTIHVPVGDWLPLNWGDQVCLTWTDEQTQRVGVGGAESVEVPVTNQQSVPQAQVYATPTFAPADGRDVPVCLMVRAEEARGLLPLRGKGQFSLTVTRSAPIATAVPFLVQRSIADDGSEVLQSKWPVPFIHTKPPPAIGSGAQATAPAATADLPRIDAGSDGAVLDIEPGASPTLELHVRESRELRFNAPLKSASGFDSTIDVEATSPQQLRVTACSTGATRIRVTDARDQLTIVTVVVTHDLTELTALLAQLYPKATIEVFAARDSVILRGSVSDADDIQQIGRIAAQFAPTVFNQLKVDDVQAKRMIPHGFRVISVDFDDAHTLARMLRPGDRVDLMVTYPHQTATGLTLEKTTALAECLEVFAIEEPTLGESKSRRVWLLVLPEYVSAIKVAQSRGSVALLWRKPDDVAPSVLHHDIVKELADIRSEPQASASTQTVPGGDADSPQSPADLHALRNDLRALHDDVRRLIDILERQNPEAEIAPSALQTPRPENGALYFMADWCGPCRRMAPLIDRLRREGLPIELVDVDANPRVASEFKVDAIPTLVFLRRGSEIDRLVGVVSEDDLRRQLARATSSQDSGRLDHSVKGSATVGGAWSMLGLRLKPADQGRLDGSHYRGGMEVTEVRPGSPAGQSAIRSGDVLVGLQVWETVSAENVDYVLTHKSVRGLDELKFYILRGRETLYGHLALPYAHTLMMRDDAVPQMAPANLIVPVKSGLSPSPAAEATPL